MVGEPVYRLYIDESGDHTYAHLDMPERRYLCLVGCFFDLAVYRQGFQPQIEALKNKYFEHDPDEPVVLHRSKLINKKGPFKVLQNTTIEDIFNTELLALVQNASFSIIAVVIDKRAHIERYGDSAWHPYHYCLTALLERYCGYLNFTNQRGDVLAESRGGREDLQLKAEYRHIYETGVYHRSAAWFQKALTSREIKLKPKSKNIAGLQLADIIAHPIKQEILYEKGCIVAVNPGFGSQLCQVLAGKYNRQVYTGEVWGYGKKFLG